MTNDVIAYYRVSTKRQGDSGLGLEAQQHAVENYARIVGGKIIAAYQEVETGTGRDPDRPQLREALLHAKRSGAVLCIAKLDRLSRNLAFLAVLMDSTAAFVACDNPHATRLHLQILAVIAEHEAKMISERTTAALAAAKRRGVLLGSARPGYWSKRQKQASLDALERGRARSLVVRRAKSEESHREASGRLLSLRGQGLTLQQIADRLNADNYWTPKGRPWHHVYVSRFLQRCRQEA